MALTTAIIGITVAVVSGLILAILKGEGRFAPKPKAPVPVSQSTTPPGATATSSTLEDEHRIWAKILAFKARDGRRSTLEALYGFKFDLGNDLHCRILRNIANQVISSSRSTGTALDLDTLKLIEDVPLVCRDLDDLELMLQNQLEIYEKGRKTILRIFDSDPNATFASDAFLRQLVVDYESKIRTSFRTMGPRVDVVTGQRYRAPLRDYSTDAVLAQISITVSLLDAKNVSRGPRPDTRHIDLAFYPTGGYNIL